MIERFSFRRLFSLICAIALVFSSVPSLPEGMEPAATHAIENETPMLEADASNAQSTSANGTAGENALFGIAISKPIATEAPVHLDVALDFSAYRAEDEASEPLVEYDTDNAYITMDLARLLRDTAWATLKKPPYPQARLTSAPSRWKACMPLRRTPPMISVMRTGH